jgi:hypothetical protein
LERQETNDAINRVLESQEHPHVHFGIGTRRLTNIIL